MNVFFENKKPNIEKFPLGGIGTGCIEIDSNGNFTGICLQNFCNEEFFERFLLEFVVKISTQDGKNYIVPLKDAECNFSFPYAYCRYFCKDIPVEINMTAFNPFIPDNIADSAIPAVYFNIEVQNHTSGEIVASCCMISKNIFDDPENTFGLSDDVDLKYIKQKDKIKREYDLQNVGELLISSDCADVSFLENFKYDSEQEKKEFYDLFSSASFFDCKSKDDSLGRCSAICSHAPVAAGDCASFNFQFSWYFPFVFNKWSAVFDQEDTNEEIFKKNIWQNCYTSFFDNSVQCALYCVKNRLSLTQRTDEYFSSLCKANIDKSVLDAILKSLYWYKYPNILVLRGADLYWIDDTDDNISRTPHGDFSFAYLFPHWARKQRIIEFNSLTSEDGAMNFCTTKALEPIYELKSSVTGRFYSVLKAYREFALSDDIAFLKEIWEKLKLVFDRAYEEYSPDFSDLFFMQSMDAPLMLCALKAVLDLSVALKEKKTTKKYSAIFYDFLQKSEKYLDDSKYNYFQILANELCINFGLSGIYDVKKVLNTLDSGSFFQNDFLYISTLLRYGKYEDSMKLLCENCGEMLRDVDKSEYIFSDNPCAFCLYSAYLGLFFDKHSQKLSITPKVSYSQDGTFNFPLNFAELAGFIEIGADYFQIKLHRGKFTVKELTIHTVPYAVLYGGRKMGFSRSGNCALLDVDLELNSKKDITIWI